MVEGIYVIYEEWDGFGVEWGAALGWDGVYVV